MSFVDSFYSLIVNISNSDTGIYTKVSFKTPKHPHESFEHLYSRIIAYLHSYHDGSTFSQGLFTPEKASIHTIDINNDILSWTYVGVPSEKSLKKSLRNSSTESRSIYFYEKSQIEKFCLNIRGSKTNWLAKINFYLIDPSFVENLYGLKIERMRWEVSITDSYCYISNEDGDTSVFVKPLDMWAEYQDSLQSLQASA